LLIIYRMFIHLQNNSIISRFKPVSRPGNARNIFLPTSSAAMLHCKLKNIVVCTCITTMLQVAIN